MSKKVLSFVMALCMLLSMVPASFAENTTLTCDCTATNYGTPKTVVELNDDLHQVTCEHGLAVFNVAHVYSTEYNTMNGTTTHHYMSCACGKIKPGSALKCTDYAKNNDGVVANEEVYTVYCALCEKYIVEHTHTEACGWSFSATALDTVVKCDASQDEDDCWNNVIDTYFYCDAAKEAIITHNHSTLTAGAAAPVATGYTYKSSGSATHEVYCTDCGLMVLGEQCQATTSTTCNDTTCTVCGGKFGTHDFENGVWIAYDETGDGTAEAHVLACATCQTPRFKAGVAKVSYADNRNKGEFNYVPHDVGATYATYMGSETKGFAVDGELKHKVECNTCKGYVYVDCDCTTELTYEYVSDTECKVFCGTASVIGEHDTETKNGTGCGSYEVCKNCGEQIGEVVAHKYTAYVPATKTVNGVVTYTGEHTSKCTKDCPVLTEACTYVLNSKTGVIACSVCGGKNQKAIDVCAEAGHDWVATAPIAPSCKYKLDGSTGKNVCSVCGTEDGEVKTIPWTHNLTETIEITAYCQSNGKVTYTCSDCSFVYVEEIDAATDARAHKMTKLVGWAKDENGKELKNDCENAGYQVYACSECGDFTSVQNTRATEPQLPADAGVVAVNQAAVKKYAQYVKVAKKGHTETNVIATITYDKAGKIVEIDTKDLNCEEGIYTYIGCAVEGCDYMKNTPTLIDNTKYVDHEMSSAITLKVKNDCTYAGVDGWTMKKCVNTGFCTYVEYYDANGNAKTVAQYEAAVKKGAGAHPVEDYNDDEVIDVNDFRQFIATVISEVSCTEDGEYILQCDKCFAQINWDADANTFVSSNKNFKYKAVGYHTNDIYNAATNAGYLAIKELNKDTAHTVNENYDEHDVAGWTYVAPTCEKSGYWVSVCADCGGNRVEVVDEVCAKTHDWVLSRYVDVELVCGEPASYERVCKVCGATEMKDGKPALTQVTELPHDWVAVGELVQEPTCSEEGIGLVVCARCGEYEYNYHIPTVGTCEFEYIYKEPTCLEPSMHGWFCVNCGIEKEMPELGKGTITEAPKPALGHKLTDGVKVTICGENRIVYMQECLRDGCDYVVYTAQDDTVLFRNGFAGIEVEDPADRDPVIANIGGQHVFGTEAEPYVIKKETCTEYGLEAIGVCSVCGWENVKGEVEYYVNPAEHDHKLNKNSTKDTYVNCQGLFYNDYTCSTCGMLIEDELITSFAKLYKTQLKRFDEDSIACHSNVKYDVINAADCRNEGWGVAYCADCTWQAEDASIIPAGHTWADELVVTVAPTCKTVGYGKKVCTVCGAESEIVVIEKTKDHSFARIIKDSGDCTKASYIVWECSVCGAADTAKGVKAATGLSYMNKTEAPFEKFLTINEKGVATYAKKVYLETAIEKIDNASDHTWGEEEYREATCEYAAGLRKTCKKCGQEKVVRADGKALGHDYYETEVKATCFVGGSYTKTCVRCGYVGENTTTEPAGHKLVSDDEDDRYVAATCSTYGTDVLKCANKCGYEELVNIEYAANAHVWETVLELKAPNCKTGAAGLARQTCALCDVAIRTNSVPAKHTWVEGDVVIQPTCAKEGLVNVTCSVCGAKDTEEIECVDHVMITKVTAATCTTAEGILTKCENCNLVTTFLKTGSAALGHKWSESSFAQPTCTTDGGYLVTCLREGCTAEKLTVAKNAAGTALYPKYNHKGWKLIETIDATCKTGTIKVYDCPICNKEVEVNDGIIKADNHDWKITATYASGITCKTPNYVDRVCNLCNKAQTKIWHTPDCTWTDYIVTEDCIYRFCLVCGTIESQWVSPTFKGFDGCALVDYAEITGVGKVKVLNGAHKGLVVEANVDATCTTDGYVGKIACTTCGMVIQEKTVIPAHTLRVEPAVAATCTQPGVKEATYCTVCDKYVVAPEAVPALGHTEVEVAEVPATAYAPGVAAGKKCTVCGEWTEGGEAIAQLTATIKRLCVLRSKAADYREDPTSEVMAMLDTVDDVTVTGAIDNEYYPVKTAQGEGFIHMSYLTVTAA